MKKALILVCAASALTACTSLQTKYESDSSRRDDGLKGMSYSLPRTDYQVAVTWMLSECPNIDLDLGEVKKTTIAVHRRLLSATATATPQVTAGERFIVDYEKLQSWVKTTSFSIETHPNGVLKSINAAADDQSGEILQAAVETAITLLPLAGAAPPVGAAPQRETDGVSDANAKKVYDRDKSKPAPPPFTPRLALGATQKIVICTAQARETLQRYEQSRDKEKSLAEGVESARQAVEDLRVVVAQRTVLPEHLTALQAALVELRKRENNLRLQKEDSETLRQELSVAADTVDWPCGPSGSVKDPYACPVTLGEKAKERLAALLEVKSLPIVSHQDLRSWADALGDDGRRRFEQLNPRVFSRFFDWAGRLESEPAPVDGCLGEASNVIDCITKTAVSTVDFTPLSPLGTLVADCKKPGCVSPAKKYQQGIFYRTPLEGTLSVKRDAGGETIFELPATVPQLGQLRFLPFRSRMFETGAIGLVLRPDGTLDRFSVGQTEAAGLRAAKAADGVATSYAGYVEERRNKGLAALQREIDLKTKQLELLRLDTELSPQAITTQTNALLADIALLRAELDRLKLERELAEARSGT